MKKRRYLLIVTLFWSLVVAGNLFAETVVKSTIQDQAAVQLTVYNHNLGLVKDIRSLPLEAGQGELRFMDVAAHILPASVQVNALNQEHPFTVLEQNYEYDLMNADKLLDKYVGKTIKIMDWNRYQDRKEVVEAELLSNNQGQVYRIDDEIYLGHPGYKILPKVPDNLISKPTLTWLYANPTAGRQELEVSYLTENISWKADYVLKLQADDSLGKLTGWVTLDNQSGGTYHQAELKLVAGDIHRVQPENRQQERLMKSMQAASAPQFEEESFFEYHLYDLQRKTTVKNRQTKQISLLTADGIALHKEYRVTGTKNAFLQKRGGRDHREPVKVFIGFKNSRDNNLGMPLPGGLVRLYKQDSAQSLQFIGEDSIDHTPKNERVRLLIGEAFDLVAERRQTEYRRISSRLHESAWEIRLRNRKQEPVSIAVIEPMTGNWQVLEASHPYTKQDAFTLKFSVDVQPDTQVTIRYKLRIGL
mgnify:FL=1